jgi:hypothetical protein
MLSTGPDFDGSRRLRTLADVRDLRFPGRACALRPEVVSAFDPLLTAESSHSPHVIVFSAQYGRSLDEQHGRMPMRSGEVPH